jgi:hypothetical protein
MKIEFTEIEIEQIKDMLLSSIANGYFNQFEFKYRKDARELHEIILRKLGLGE